MKFQAAALWLAATAAASADPEAVQTPPNHPPVHIHPTLAKFSQHFRCPYANEWVTKGPHQAAIDLGLVKKSDGKQQQNATFTTDMKQMMVPSRNNIRRHHRSLQDNAAMGHCTFTNTWTGAPSCVEFRGTFDETELLSRCGSEQDSALTMGSGCMITTASDSEVVSWCLVDVDGGVEASPMMGDCGQNQMACESFMNGVFGTDCSATDPESASDVPFPYDVPANADQNVNCRIAPGAIGAGHQAAYSVGYSSECPGTPAEGSPYMWPMAWRANVESESMAFGSDDIIFTSKGIVSYRLDKNWKRQDWYYQRGVQRGVGQAPCPPGDIDLEFSEGTVLACRRNTDDYSTMIHRGSKMFFIDWKNGTEVGSSDPSNIANCNYLDLQVVGNIRPDWYTDDLGDSTDVQYLGDQHVYYQNEPRLVKQWRKKDFANQYFVMSMLGNPNEDGRHWPMILNVPGEGFGDDFLQKYSNHSLLTDDDDYMFLLDEALEAIGGSCPQMGGFGDDEQGPPTNSDVHIPSNLEVDPNSWFSNVYTFSPVWEPETTAATADSQDTIASEPTGMATVDADRLTVQSCYDDDAMAIRMHIEFKDIELVGSSQTIPWMALGTRETEECLMNPRSGADSPMVLVMHSPEVEKPKAFSGMLPAAARGGSQEAVSSIYSTLTDLELSESFSNVYLQVPTSDEAIEPRDVSIELNNDASDTVVLEFSQSIAKADIPETMFMTYAIGSQATLGFHSTRACFEVTEFPSCPLTDQGMGDSTSTQAQPEDSAAFSFGASVGLFTTFVAMVTTFLF